MESNGSAPSWPGLYNPGIDWLPFDGKEPVQPGGQYLSNANDVFRYTLYWHLVYYCVMFSLCGGYAFINLAFRPGSRPSSTQHQEASVNDEGGHSFPLSPVSPNSSSTPTSTTFLTAPRFRLRWTGTGTTTIHDHNAPSSDNHHDYHYRTQSLQAPHKQNEVRSRITFAFIVLFLFLALGTADAFISSAILGFILAAVFSAAGFYVSTWVPFLFSTLHVLVGLLSIYPWVIDII